MTEVESLVMGRVVGGLSERNLNPSWTGSCRLACAYRDRLRRRHLRLVVICCSFGLRGRGGCGRYLRDWRVGW